MIEQLGAGEVAHDQRDAVVAGIDAGNDALRFRNRETKPVHAGVDMDAGAAFPARAAAEHVPFGEFVEIADHGPGVDLGIGVAAVLEEAVEHIDGGRRHGGASGAGLVHGGDEKRLAAGGGKRPGDRIEAAAIGVRLDHAGAFGRHRGFLELAPVGDDGVEVDGQDAGGGRERRRLTGLGRQQLADRFRVGGDVHAAVLRATVRRFNRAARVNRPDPEAGRRGRDRRTG